MIPSSIWLKRLICSNFFLLFLNLLQVNKVPISVAADPRFHRFTPSQEEVRQPIIWLNGCQKCMKIKEI